MVRLLLAALALLIWAPPVALATKGPPVVTPSLLAAASPAAKEAFGLCVKTAVESCAVVQCHPDPLGTAVTDDGRGKHDRCVRPYARCLGRHVQECGARHIPGVAR